MRTGSAAVSRIINKKKSAGENRRKSDTATFFSYTVSMRKEKREQLTRQLTKSLELPGDLMLGASIVTVTGRRDLAIENYKGILEYRQDKIRLLLKNGQLEITGRDLKIDYYTNDDMKITGQVDKLEYGM